MRKQTSIRKLTIACILVLLVLPAAAQNKKLWVLRAPGEVVEVDATTFAERQSVKVPSEAIETPANFSVNQVGQMLFAASVALPLSEEDAAAAKKIWFWDGKIATTLTRDVSRSTATTGSNLAISESAPVPFLSADGSHLYWFSNQARRLQRDGVDLSTRTTWQSWQTDLAGNNRQDLASVNLAECSCPTGGCEESCPYGHVWIPGEGLADFLLLTQVIEGQTQITYKSTSSYQQNSGKWSAKPIDPPIRTVLDAKNPATILEAIPDTGCCGWSNQSNDQTVLHLAARAITLFDERATYNNPDYDVSFYTADGKLSPDASSVAFTISATSSPDKPIQLADDGQANPKEAQEIRKALQDLPAVEIKSIEDTPRRIAFLPHASFIGWLDSKEILIVENHLLVAYNMATAARRKSNIRVEDAGHVFLR
jgi:hypothetical protein